MPHCACARIANEHELCCCLVVRSVGYITEEEAQQALLELVSTTRCYGQSAAREMEIYRIVPSSALHVSTDR